MFPQTPQEIIAMSTISYVNAMGSLIHAITSTRLDIAFAVNYTTQFMVHLRPIQTYISLFSKAHSPMAYCIAVLMLAFNLKVGEMTMGLVMSKLVGPSLTLLLLLEVLLFPSSSKKYIFFFLPIKLKTLLVLQLLRNILGYDNSLQILAIINLLLSLFFVTTNLPFCCPRIPSFMINRNILLFGIIIYMKRWIP
jgi:hypothetical protein